MYENIIKNYVDKLTKEDIINYSKKEDIFLNDNEINVIYDEIKNKKFNDNLINDIINYYKK